MKTRFININKHQIAYFDNGVDATETIVCVHGNSSSKESFADFAKRIKDKRVVAFDLYGHGESDRAKDLDLYTLKGYSNLLSSFLSELNLGSFYLLGHSLGGHIAIESLPLVRVKPLKLVVFGTPPLSGAQDIPNAFVSDPLIGQLFSGKVSNSDCEKLADLNLSDQNNKNVWIEIFRKTDSKAREHLGASLNMGTVEDELKIITQEQIEVYIINCLQDKIINCSYIKNLEENLNLNIAPYSFSHCPHFEGVKDFTLLVSRLFNHEGEASER